MLMSWQTFGNMAMLVKFGEQSLNTIRLSYMSKVARYFVTLLLNFLSILYSMPFIVNFTDGKGKTIFLLLELKVIIFSYFSTKTIFTPC